MVETVLLICAACALAFAINLVPAFMPATWMVLAFFYIRFDLPLLLLVLGGTLASAAGRTLLARGSTLFKRRFMIREQSDLDDLGAFLDRHRRYAGLAVFGYSLSPLPTNNLFIAAGMVEIRLGWVVGGFIAARLFANTFLVWTTHAAFESLGGVFEGALSGPLALALEAMSVISIVLLYRLPWARWLRRLADRG